MFVGLQHGRAEAGSYAASRWRPRPARSRRKCGANPISCSVGSYSFLLRLLLLTSLAVIITESFMAHKKDDVGPTAGKFGAGDYSPETRPPTVSSMFELSPATYFFYETAKNKVDAENAWLNSEDLVFKPGPLIKQYMAFNFTYLDINTLFITPGMMYILDLAAQLDANASVRIWTMMAGGGASVIYTDAICCLGCSSLFANYGEYSEAPSEQQMYDDAMTFLSMKSREKHSDGKVLIFMGGIDKFMNVATPVNGILTALEEQPSKEATIDLTRTFGAGGIPKTSPTTTPTVSSTIVSFSTTSLIFKTTTSIICGLQIRLVKGMLDFDYVCWREQPSVACMVYSMSVTIDMLTCCGDVEKNPGPGRINDQEDVNTDNYVELLENVAAMDRFELMSKLNRFSVEVDDDEETAKLMNILKKVILEEIL